MSSEPTLKEIQKEWHGSYRAYAIGFMSSIILTILSFSMVLLKLLEGKALMVVITGLALIQAVFQLRFFLHLGEEPKPKWESLTFYLMLIILLIVAIGSLWIMFDLNDRMMPAMGKEMGHD
ncbi:cytochrome o ubiquinol oxidase subunit IV [Estrella lausannensis]|uniref:Cytochrome bo(3) ubiquinol oxidase subunit 4 n=1 Tax=Estrella lausannensis TaxID=483423 RepID=A0A0H5DPR9_9BACT|nr:cytochrome o ubiquinol oxidase subunit IV [Estrella lausannensis]CRX38467.1 Cytochrome o ubiquinol oxidase, subunit IV [Estrella lausannensis]